jgi:ABC-type polysaccharide/polyol phosphate export permease
LSSVPRKYLPLYRFNPLVRLLNAYRAVLLQGAQPDWQALLFPCVLAVGLLCTGYVVFLKTSYRFVEEL